jgi:hypothetical protein
MLEKLSMEILFPSLSNITFDSNVTNITRSKLAKSLLTILI